MISISNKITYIFKPAWSRAGGAPEIRDNFYTFILYRKNYPFNILIWFFKILKYLLTDCVGDLDQAVLGPRRPWPVESCNILKRKLKLDNNSVPNYSDLATTFPSGKFFRQRKFFNPESCHVGR